MIKTKQICDFRFDDAMRLVGLNQFWQHKIMMKVQLIEDGLTPASGMGIEIAGTGSITGFGPVVSGEPEIDIFMR